LLLIRTCCVFEITRSYALGDLPHCFVKKECCLQIWKVGDRRSIIRQFRADDVARFVDSTGDDNPIHVSAEYARGTPAGGTIVHGMLAASHISALIGKEIPGDGAVWSSFNVVWRNPIRIGDQVRFEAEIKQFSVSSQMLTLEIIGTNETRKNISLEATAKVLIMQPELSETPKVGLNGKRILVTGASGVLGSTVANRLQQLGAIPVLWSRDLDRLATVSGASEKFVVDMSNTNSLDKGIKALIEGGKVGGIVHLAAPPARIIGVDDPENINELMTHFNVGPLAFSRICATLLPSMEAGTSLVVVLTQYANGVPPPKMSAYIASKLASLGLVRSIAAEFGPKGIRCNAVSPGIINTPYSEHIPMRLKQIEAATNPLRRLCVPNDVADAVCFLLGSDAAFINGANLSLTGGAVMS
jgi:3-oxoacyl-[acyl-carrier protein] reductase